VAYAESEREARARREGLWREPDAVPPWQFRHHSAAPSERFASVR